MAIEFSVTHQPKYRFAYILPEQALGNGASIPKTPGITKVVSNIYMINLVYDLKGFKKLTPFVIIGGGIAQVKVKATSSSFRNQQFFKINNTDNNCLAWQTGIGLSQEITPNLSLGASVKLQVVHNIKVKYDTLDMSVQKFVAAKPIKKTIGVGEFGVGFTYKLPI
jgi:opacity protein-like surface antigen